MGIFAEMGKTHAFFGAILFMAIFAMKLALAVAPVVFQAKDTGATKAAIMQLEVEHGEDDDVTKAGAGNSEYLVAGGWNFSPVFTAEVTAKVLPLLEEGCVKLHYCKVPTPPPDCYC